MHSLNTQHPQRDPLSPTHTARSHLEVVDEPRIVELGLFGIDGFGVDTHLSISLGVHLSPEKIRCWECVNLGVKVSQHLIIKKLKKQKNMFCYHHLDNWRTYEHFIPRFKRKSET